MTFFFFAMLICSLESEDRHSIGHLFVYSLRNVNMLIHRRQVCQVKLGGFIVGCPASLIMPR